MNKGSRLITLFLSAAFLLAACGHGGAQSGSETAGESFENSSSSVAEIGKETMPDYINSPAENPFVVGMWIGIPEYKTLLDENDFVVGQQAWTDEEFVQQYVWMKEAGFNLAATPGGSFSVDHIVRLLEAAEEVGINQLVWDASLNNVLLNTSLSEEEALAQARRIVMEYRDYDSFYGNMITDEPGTSEFAALKVAAERYKKLLPDKMFYLNLFPVYATPAQLQCDDYEEYLREYLTLGQDYLCYDNYPLVGSGSSARLLDTFLYNFQLAQNASPDVKVWTFLQAMGYGGRKDPDCETDFRIQTSCALAYGVSAIQWFCYYSPQYGGAESFTPAIITLDGKKTEKYEYVKAVNDELHAFENVYTNFKWERAMNIVGTTNSKGENPAFNYYETDNSHDRIKKLTAEKDAVVGVFKDGDGRDGFMIANYDAPASAAENVVEIEFYGCTQVLCYVNGEARTVEVKNGKISLALKAGDGAFVVPLNI